MILGRNKHLQFKCICDKVKQRLEGWQMKTSSQAGCLVLIRSVAFALPTYTMANYILPKSICSTLDSLMMRFWWGFFDNRHHQCLKSWASMCKPKREGGLGLRLMEDHNKALIAKMARQVQTRPENLWVNLIRAKYLRSKFVWDAPASVGASRFWKGVTCVAPILQVAACFQIGLGRDIRVWLDPRIPFPTSHCPQPRIDAIVVDAELRVDSLVFLFSQFWNAILIRNIFCPEDAEVILSLPAPGENLVYTIRWTADSSGQFTLKSVHSLIANNVANPSVLVENDWKKLWRLPMPDHLKLFLWKVSWNCLPSKDNVGRFVQRTSDADFCVLCS